MRRCLPFVLLLLVLPPASAAAEDARSWPELVRATGMAFARPGGLETKRRMVADLAKTGRADAWVLILVALERAGRHLADLARVRAAAWQHTQSLWSQPQGRHHVAHARRLRKSFETLGKADRAWFRERMLIGQMAARLRSAPPEARALFAREASIQVGLLHPVTRAALSTSMVDGLKDVDGIAAYRQILERDEDERVRLAALDALPDKGRTVRPMLMRRLRDRSSIVRIAAARRLAKTGAADAAPMLQRAMARAGPREALAHHAALRELGVDAPKPDPGPVSLYGTPVPSEHVVFVLDASVAMAEALEHAKAEVEAAIRALPEQGSFGLVVFNGAVMRWKADAVPATAENKDAAAAWLAGHEPAWNACLDGALREAFRIAGLAPLDGRDTQIDTIAIVAAGGPDAYAPGKAGPIRKGYVERLAGVWNRNGRIRIQGVALSNGPVRALLEQLARDHDGTLTTP